MWPLMHIQLYFSQGELLTAWISFCVTHNHAHYPQTSSSASTVILSVRYGIYLRIWTVALTCTCISHQCIYFEGGFQSIFVVFWICIFVVFWICAGRQAPTRIRQCIDWSSWPLRASDPTSLNNECVDPWYSACQTCPHFQPNGINLSITLIIHLHGNT